MSGQALYRRYRSQTFEEVIAQDHVTRTLQNALRAERIAHAYLFTGPRGTGKTSTARILAKAVNCLAEPAERPCNRCARCQAVNEGRDLDLIEIDAASNRGIDEIRDLREKIAFAPNEGRFKVYVIDEVHMLTSEAFNALLKTLEEPPAHVIFVLATTEPQRIPATILSRCQRFDFRRISLADLSGKLERICAAEGISIQPAAVEAIARRAGGSFRDAESLLDQLAAYGEAEITLERVQELLGAVSAQAVAGLVDAWLAADVGGGLRAINELVDGGTDARQLHLQVLEYLRSLLLLQAGGDDKLAGAGPEATARMRAQLQGLSLGRLVEAIRLFSQGEAARGDVRPQLPLELAFVRAALAGGPREEGQAGDAPPVAERRPAKGPAHRPRPPSGQRTAQTGARPSEARVQESAPQPAEPADPEAARLAERWPEVLQALHEKKNLSLEAVLRSGRPCRVDGGRVVLAMTGSFHCERVMEEKNRRLLEEVLAGLLGTPCQVECIVDGERRPAGRNRGIDHPVAREDPIVRYAVRDLGAQVGRVQADDGEQASAADSR